MDIFPKEVACTYHQICMVLHFDWVFHRLLIDFFGPIDLSRA